MLLVCSIGMCIHCYLLCSITDILSVSRVVALSLSQIGNVVMCCRCSQTAKIQFSILNSDQFRHIYDRLFHIISLNHAHVQTSFPLMPSDAFLQKNVWYYGSYNKGCFSNTGHIIGPGCSLGLLGLSSFKLFFICSIVALWVIVA